MIMDKQTGDDRRHEHRSLMRCFREAKSHPASSEHAAGAAETRAMRDWDYSSYGQFYAEDYDALFGNRDDLEVMTRRLRALAAGGPVLEFGIGTGRIALPLAQAGVEVHGLELSEKMISILRSKPGGARIPVTMGDFCEAVVDRSFSMVLVLFSTLFSITTQEDQVRCFENAARHLQPGGLFIVEGFLHDRARFVKGQSIQVREIDTNSVTVQVSRHDALQQLLETQRIGLSAQGIKLLPNRLRYIWPSELDLMGRIAGFRLRDRWVDWYGGRFTADSEQYIAIYERV
jgi:SAM-dependent methyltransferase